MEQSIYYPLTAIYNVLYDQQLDTLILFTDKNNIDITKIPQGKPSIIYIKNTNKRYREFKDRRNNYVKQEIDIFHEIKSITLPQFKSILIYTDMNEFILPNITGSVNLSINGKSFERISISNYNKLRNLKNIELLDYMDWCCRVDYHKFVNNKFGDNFETKYYFNLSYNENNSCTINLKYGKLYNQGHSFVDSFITPLINNIIEYLPTIDKIIYYPTSITNLDYEIEEIKNIILPLKLKIIVELEY
jgi:hypothetical protein